MKDILTEAEAKTRTCPIIRGQHEAIPDTKNSMSSLVEMAPRCIAGECMAWRLSHKDGPYGEETGYCGAFGVPRFT